MEEINFLSNKKEADSQDKKGTKKEPEKEVTRSEPIKDKEIKGVALKNKPVSWFSFFKKFLPEKNKLSEASQLGKIKDSRQAVLKQIKADSEDSKKKQGKYEEKKKKRISSLLSWSQKDNITASDKDKKVVVDYQELFNKEKKKKRRELELMQKKEEIKNKTQEKENIKEKGKEKVPEEQSDKTRREEKEYYSPAKESRGLNIIGANLIKDELVTFFDWKKNIILLLSFVIASCLVIGIVYGVLTYWEKQKEEQSEVTAQKFNELILQIRQINSEEKEIFIFQKRLKQSAQLLEQHIYWINFLEFLENYTIKDVYFYNFSGDINGNYTIPAWAKDFKTLAKQIKIFKALDNVERVKVTGGGVGKTSRSGINFSLIISIDPKIFYR